jgi:hypothetical protein
MSKTSLVVSAAPAKADTCQELPRMDQLLAGLPEAIRNKANAVEGEETSLKAIGERATLDAPSVFWMVKGAPGYDKTYYKSTNTRVCDAVIASGKVAADSADKYAQRVRDYAAEYVLALMEAGNLLDASGHEVEVPDVVFDKLVTMSDRTPAGLTRKAAAKAAKANEEGGNTRPDDVRCYEHLLAAYKVAYKSEGDWAVKYLKVLKVLITPEDMAELAKKTDTKAK